ncbi:MAG TPA: hypothetical protein VEP30_07310 [Chthoniobacterales bacterium]|nr:hypothetical protein [Chthoniobacterales bacterium]
MSGKATLGSDYTLSGNSQVTVPAGQTAGSVTLNAIVDKVTLQSGTGHNLPPTSGKKKKKPSGPSATVTISD